MMTESKNWGGSRSGAGRKPKAESEKIKSVVVRVPEHLVDAIEQLKQGNAVTNNQDAGKLQAEIDLLYVKAVTCFQCTNWINDKCSQRLKPVGFTCDSFESWQAEIERLNAEIEKSKEPTNSKKLKELKQENKELVQQNDKLYQQILSLESRIAESNQAQNELKKQAELQYERFIKTVNLSIDDFAEFQKNHFVQFGKQADLKGNKSQ